ncbi:MAG TPA: isoprenylcysteine carboxylmethyltransferase family protein [Polyangia bacterium]|jgi:methyltransferase|nr:isoprenylcysteine carboxylmethyltransferase family protein [Polyangia bacterium]
MGLSLPFSVEVYLGLLALVGAGRLIEMRLSRRHQRALAARGIAIEREPVFGLMVALHTGVLAAAALEVILLRRAFYSTPGLTAPVLGLTALALVVLANLLRWWVIATLGPQWNIRVMGSSRVSGVVSTGPFRFVRHPNYVAVFVELAALPLVHGAWLTALWGSLMHVLILRRRIALEERVLFADARYREVMGRKHRFVPLPWPPSS